ncbi:GntR family transcriptional regulator [Thiothrix nivea]|uniref:Transcriptional regulator, GntR family n=1 Tax=Thiothrix nivea (strain ATCC 35100 / DSM 5205 / JP2) TaxID=870187 RepID=A0A656H9Z3_THINJ|nr:GntR family transcriptional regulator [Thiothrix nivea]EIJ33027.1 transcriptional regulator, GntR family [Thiothrix nivea DSM 5205]
MLAPHTTPEGTLADVASTRLTQAIITGELLQGQKLNEADLAERYGIGRGPLREALRQLEGMRLVRRIPHAGARVVTLNREMMADLYAVREALEGMACRTAATRMTEAEIANLKELLDKHAEQIEATEGQIYFQNEGDFDFHYQIALGSRNQMLIDLLAGELYQLLRMCRYRTSRLAKRTRPALQQHRHIVEAIADRDGELAEMLMRRHISGAWKSISDMMDEEYDSKANPFSRSKAASGS